MNDNGSENEQNPIDIIHWQEQDINKENAHQLCNWTKLFINLFAKLNLK